MPEFTCAACGSAFSLSQKALDRYPGWTPKRCRSCRGAVGAESGGGGRPAKGQPVEENLPVADVLARYHGGPQDGVFTDGSAHPNPGAGGWGAVYVVDGEVVAQRHGSEAHTTNNRMELTALLHGYDLVPAGVRTTMYSDSRLCVRTVNEWAEGWAANGWKRRTGPISNLDLVKAVYAKARSRPEVTLRWIRAHDGSRWNEYADALSTAYRRSML